MYKQQLFSIFLFAITIVFLSGVEGEPEVFMVSVNPSDVDNQQEEEITFEGDCNVCNNEEELSYFMWNSSIAGILHEGSDPFELSFVEMSSSFSTGEHNITLQVKDNNGAWSQITANSTTVLNVAGRDGPGSGDITVNFAITPPSIHLGETARFEACTEMQPEPQPCHGDIDPDLDFRWEIQLEGETDWAYLNDQEVFESNNFEVGNHTVRLTITDNSDDSQASDTAELVVLPPIPSVAVSGPGQVTIKEGQTLDLTANCYDNENQEINCSFLWEIWEDDPNGDLLFTYDTKEISLTDLNNEVKNYDVMVKGTDNSGTPSQWAHVFVTVNPPNESPSAIITISPESLGGLTPEYFEGTEMSFQSEDSFDSDGTIVAQKWWFDGAVVSEDSVWVWKPSLDTTGIFQVKLEVQDDDGVWSSIVSTNFKLIDNSDPESSWRVINEDNGTWFLVSDCNDPDEKGFISSYHWSVSFADEILFNSTERNLSFTPSMAGLYTISLQCRDNGGLQSILYEDHITVDDIAPKNFVASFSSKNIQPGDEFSIDFSNTSGAVDYFEIIVNNPNGSKDKYETSELTYSIIFDDKGTYTLDITVFWADGVPLGGLSDWYGPTVYVGTDGEEQNNGDGDEVDNLLPDDEEGLPSLSFVAIITMTFVVAFTRRQR